MARASAPRVGSIPVQAALAFEFRPGRPSPMVLHVPPTALLMKPSVVIAILLVMALFMGGVIMATLQRGEVECEVCLEFPHGEVCRSGRGPTQAEALRAAQESACGGNVSGMAELIACRGAVPSSVQCPDD